jgi:hypothetical protein
MTDQELLARFEDATLPNASFRHLDHLRVAWLYLRDHGPRGGEERMIAGLGRFAAAHGVPQLYNETLTRFWVRLVAHVMEAFPARSEFADLLSGFPRLADKGLVFRHYREETLRSDLARRTLVLPDILPLPRLAHDAS